MPKEMNISFLNFFKKPHRQIPELVKNEFSVRFKGAINIEWDKKPTYYEAVFYLNEVEHIAQIGDDGQLIQYKKNLWPAELPALVKESCLKEGELMNAIVIVKNKDKTFEVIVRDANFERTLLLVTEAGEIERKPIV